MQYKLRRANHSDISSMIILLRTLFSLETDFEFNEVNQQKGLELMLEDLTNRYIVVAELDGKSIGMCTAQILVSTAEGGISAVIEDLVVEEAYHRQGIGKELLLAVEGWAWERGVRRLQLLADRNNTRALEFYKGIHWKFTQLICLQKKRS